MMKQPSIPRTAQALALRQKGYTLIELSIALAIISVIIVGSLIGVQRILANNRANNLLSEVPRINAALVGAAVNSDANAFSSLDTTKAASLGAFTPSTVDWTDPNNVKVSNAFGGNLFIQGNNATFDNVKRGYVVVATRVPTEMCATVVNGLAPLAQGLWVNQETTGFDTALANAPTALIKGPQQNSSLDLGELAKQCRGTGEATQTIHAFVAI